MFVGAFDRGRVSDPLTLDIQWAKGRFRGHEMGWNSLTWWKFRSFIDNELDALAGFVERRIRVVGVRLEAWLTDINWPIVYLSHDDSEESEPDSE